MVVYFRYLKIPFSFIYLGEIFCFAKTPRRLENPHNNHVIQRAEQRKERKKGRRGGKEGFLLLLFWLVVHESGLQSPTCQDCVSANLKESEWSHWINCATFREKKRAEGVDLEADLQLPHAFGEEEKQEEVEKEEGEEQIVIGDDWEEEVLLDADDAPLRRMPLPSDMSYLGLPVASLMKRDQAKEKSLTVL